ncbi:stress-induced-phosphoprotein 1-like [Rhopilema esculentum]|uniref:stress-induced-phosphoprotein 1-like n=1 Tax=Rhopilema esculentum TaxID=499914 RepID=UPI0031D33B1D|eukprot:gene3037-1311_t
MAEEEANQLKSKGNKFLQEGDFGKAIECYSEAIELCPKNHVLFSNRSAAFAKQEKYSEALVDAKRTVELNPQWGKGYSRLGAALTYLGRYAEAKQAYEDGLKYDADNEQLKSGLEDVKSRITTSSSNRQKRASPFDSADVQAKLLADPSTKEFMKDPEFLEILNNIKSNPDMLGMYINDPRVMQALGVILGINIQTAGGQGASQSQDDLPNPKPKEEKAESKTKTEEATEVDTRTESQKEAENEKESGNAAYKKKDFDTALKHYGKAIELDPENIAYYTNRAAVYFEQKKYEDCIKQCEEAVEVGRKNKAEYKAIAKALSRIGNAYAKMEVFDKAMRYYDLSLAEFRSPDVIKRADELKKLMKDKERLEYIDKDKAEEERVKGNELFSQGKYPEAIKHYTEALRRNPDDARVYSNRAACYTKLAEFRLAIKDCDDCLKINPDFVKGHLRKAGALLAVKENRKAQDAYKKALELDPNCQEAKEGLNKSMYARYSADPEQRKREAMQDPEVQSIMMDPAMRMILEQMQEDPRAATEHLRNPEIAMKIKKLMDAGILSMK